MQIPGGWLLDKFGSKKVYSYSLFFWSLFTFLQGFIDVFPLAWAGVSMFFMRFMLGFSEAPSFPANARIVAAWFPAKERVRLQLSLMPLSTSRWLCSRRCSAG